MTKAQHTPGPWATNSGSVFPATGGNKICEMLDTHRRSLVESCANARLIVAAPELLAALDDVVGICQDSLETHFGNKLGKKIRMAIAKAKGE